MYYATAANVKPALIRATTKTPRVCFNPKPLSRERPEPPQRRGRRRPATLAFEPLRQGYIRGLFRDAGEDALLEEQKSRSM